MSKLEDKLTASIKPARKPAVTRTGAGKARPAPAPTPETPPAPAAADLNSPAQPPHPLRIWPD